MGYLRRHNFIHVTSDGPCGQEFRSLAELDAHAPACEAIREAAGEAEVENVIAAAEAPTIDPWDTHLDPGEVLTVAQVLLSAAIAHRTSGDMMGAREAARYSALFAKIGANGNSLTAAPF